MKPERLDKLLAATGRWSRSQVKALIRQGRVLVDGQLPPAPQHPCNPGTARIQVDGETVCCAEQTYILLHKPAGLVSATRDTRQPTVLSLLPPELQRRGLFPVGRLDKDTTGLLLLTDDGPLAHGLLSPKRHVEKVYRAGVTGKIQPGDVAAVAAGLVLGDGLHCLPARLEPLEDGSQCLVILHEGKYHQVKRMLAALGKPVHTLTRIAMGPLHLDPTLAPGQWRHLHPAELAALKGVVGIEAEY